MKKITLFKLVRNIIKLIKSYPNDQDLGCQVRNLIKTAHEHR